MIPNQPFRLMFPLGIIMLLLGILLWLPQIWVHDAYPIELHRYFVLNGFTVCFFAGFLLTEIRAHKMFVILLMLVTILGLGVYQYQYWVISVQATILMSACFLFQKKRFIYWTILSIAFWYYNFQWAPLFFIIELSLNMGKKTTVDKCSWIALYTVVLSIILNLFWVDGGVHASHAFFIGGTVLFFLLRALKLNRPDENSKLIYLMTFLILFSMATRVSAYLLPNVYLTHLGHSALILILGILIWIRQYFLT